MNYSCPFPCIWEARGAGEGDEYSDVSYSVYLRLPGQGSEYSCSAQGHEAPVTPTD